MNDKNFDSIHKFEVPKDWVDNVLNIAKVQNEKSPIPFIRFSRTIAAVAVILIVCGLSVSLFLITNDEAIPPVSTREETDSENSQVTKEPTKTDSKDETKDSQGSFIEPTEHTTHENSTKGQESETKLPGKPTSKPTKVPNESDIITEPTQGTTDKPPYEEPTENPEPWEPPVTPHPSETTVPPTQKVPQKEDVYIHVRFSTELLVGSGKIYCKVVDSSGNLIGDPNLYSSEHLAEINRIHDGYTFVRYYPYVKNLITKRDVYSFYFYNEDGVIVKQSINHALDRWENMY